MLTLDTLPNEILMNILDLCRKDVKSFRSLALVARRLHILTAKYLLRNVELVVETPEPGRLKSPKVTVVYVYLTKRLSENILIYDLFLRSITETPRLVDYIHNVTLSWQSCNLPSQFYDEYHQKGECKGLARANQLLDKVPNLQELTIRASRHHAGLFVPTFFQVNPAHRLRKLFISGFKTTVNEVAWYLAHPNLREIEICFLDPLAPFDEATLANIKAEEYQRAALSVLKLGTGDMAHLQISELHKLLSIPSKVDTLHCPIPGREQFFQGRRSEALPMDQPLSPSSIVYALSPLRENLTDLQLWDSAGQRWPRHDLSVMDLSAFSSLRKLRAPSSCFFPTSGPQFPRLGVWRLLPQSLQELSVSPSLKACTVSKISADCFESSPGLVQFPVKFPLYA